jgi:hypothetical protein
MGELNIQGDVLDSNQEGSEAPFVSLLFLCSCSTVTVQNKRPVQFPKCIQVRDRHLFDLEICVTFVNGVLPYPLPAGVFFFVCFVFASCFGTLTCHIIQFEYEKGKHCWACHIYLPSGMCHLFHSLNHRRFKRTDCHSCVFACIFNRLERSGAGDRGSTVVKVLCYKSEGRWFDPRWCHWNLSLT